MEKRRKQRALFLTVMLLAALLCGCVRVVENAQRKVIGVVAKRDGGSFWQAVLAGAEDAAMENGYAITFRGPEVDGPEGLETQKKIMALALENQVCGMVVAAVGPGLDGLLAQADEQYMPVIQFDSGIFPQDLEKLKAEKCNPVVASVYTNNREAAALNAEHLFRAVRQDIAASMVPYVVGILQHDRTATGVEREDGFRQKFIELGEEDPETRGKFIVTTEHCPTEKQNAYGKALERLRKQGARAVFLTNQETVNQTYDMIRNHPGLYDYMVFTGFDSGKKQVEWLRDSESPRLIGSVTQDPYQIGYNGVMQCINGMEARGVTAFVEVPAYWYDRENVEFLVNRNIVFD